jgi:hypothetical protein
MEEEEKEKEPTCKNCQEFVDIEEQGWFCCKACYDEYAFDMFEDV